MIIDLFFINSISKGNSAVFKSISRSATKAFIITIFFSPARLLYNTLESIATLLSENANGIEPPRCCLEGITFCDTTISTSFSVKVNMKSSGNKSIFLRTAYSKALVFKP